ncbi:sugar phosphate isomerase/epimerase family protein [Frateuria aurantia]
MQKLFINTILLGGTTAEKIEAAKTAGFDQIELWRQDLEQLGNDAAAAARLLDQASIGLTDYQVLLDFDGAPDSKRAAKRAEAVSMLDTAVAVGATTLLVPASTDFACRPERIVEDMRWLAREAGQRGLRIAHEGMAWSTVHSSLPAVWKVVQEVGEPNLGVVVDAFHIFARCRTAADLDGIPRDRIFLVQLSDLDTELNPGNLVEIARHHRLLPGEGSFPLASLLEKLSDYHGPIGLEVFNDALKSQNPLEVAAKAMASLKRVLPSMKPDYAVEA